MTQGSDAFTFATARAYQGAKNSTSIKSSFLTDFSKLSDVRLITSDSASAAITSEEKASSVAGMSDERRMVAVGEEFANSRSTLFIRPI